jgi:hypothetical protein
VRGVVEQVAAVEEGNDLDAGGQDVVVELFDLGVDAFEGGVGVVALLQQDDAFDDVVVVDELAVFAAMILLTRGRTGGHRTRRFVESGLQVLPIWPRRILGPCTTVAMSLTRRAVPF